MLQALKRRVPGWAPWIGVLTATLLGLGVATLVLQRDSAKPVATGTVVPTAPTTTADSLPSTTMATRVTPPPSEALGPTAPPSIVRSTVAHAVGPAVGVFASPGAAQPERSLTNPQPSGAPLVFLVLSQEPEWLNVLLPVRPNGSRGWVRKADVTLTQHSYAVVVERRAHRLTVFNAGQVIVQEPVGIGTASTPTPGGLYYLKELLKPPDPNTVYGTYAYGLSGFSDVLTSFQGGEAVIGLHGTNDPAGIGKDVSAGCIRMSNAAITRLAEMLPLGTPVEIRA